MSFKDANWLLELYRLCLEVKFDEFCSYLMILVVSSFKDANWFPSELYYVCSVVELAKF